MGPIRGILFDLGDTILDFGPVDTIELFEQGARLTYDYLKGLGQPLPSFSTYHRRQLRAIRWAYAFSRLTRREFNALELLGSLSRGMGHKLSHEQFEQLAWLWYEPLGRHATVEAGLPDLLERFTQEGLTLAIASNTFIPAEVLDRHLRELDLLKFFPIRVYSCDVRYRKPHPQIFRLVLERMALSAEQVLLVGDSIVADIKGGNRAGMITVLKDPAGRKTHRRIHPRHRIRQLTELPPLLEQYR